MYPKKIFYYIGDTVTVKCPTGYQPNPSSVRCVKIGSSIGWNNPPQCIAQCSPPIIPNMEYISVDKEYYNKNEEIIVRCQSGYYPSSDTITCDNPRSSQEWTPSVTCIGVTMDWRVTSSSISRQISCTPQCPDIWRFTVQCCDMTDRYRSCKTSSGKSVTFTDLQPSTEYEIYVGRTTHWGHYLGILEVIYIRTKDSVPGQIEIKKVPSMEDNTIRWSLSEKWGNITGFQMNISAWRDYNVLFAVDESLQFPPNVTEYKIPLQYGTNYTITLQGFTSGGPGEVTTQNIETDIGDPPLHMEETISDVTLQLQPVLSLNGPIRSYEIIVFGGHEGNSTKECLNFKNTPYNSSWTISRYTAAVLHAETLIGPRTFTLGDNHHYNGFHNAPLIPNHNYTIYIRVTSHWNHVDKSSCAFVGFLQIPPESASSITPIIAGSIAAVCLLLILLFLVILWRSRSSRDVIIALFLKKQAVAP
ncbi:receptor-type tyrosine-protein phosphatase T-like isoform X2 [Aquarana catesbeiana]|uniref:receptor-type tyrosine-protein phosphatase T-like isoform X2 n=1 Tax=Aquarana catesbeiana TaxID=8400 RepID=UPI003CC9BADA